VPAPRTTADLDVSYPDSPAEAMRNASELWLIDQNDPTALQRGTADHRLWNDVSLRWHTDPGQMPDQPARGVRIGLSDVQRFRTTVDMFATLDDRYGGGHARQALVRYLSTDADRMLNGRYDDTVGRRVGADRVAEDTDADGVPTFIYGVRSFPADIGGAMDVTAVPPWERRTAGHRGTSRS